MALARSSIFAALSGNLPGTEVAMTKHGMVVKRRKPAKKMNSPAEIAAKKTFIEWNKRWAALTVDQVQAFNAHAATHPVTDRLGASKYISGKNWFMKLRMPISDEYDDFVETMPPLDTTMPVWHESRELWFDGPYGMWLLTHAIPAEYVVFSIWVARWQSPTTTHKPQRWIPIPPVKNWPYIYDWYDMFIAAGVKLQAGERVAIKCVVRLANKWPSPPHILWRTVQPPIHALYRCDDAFPTSAVLDAKYVNPAVQYSGGAPDDTFSHSVAGHIGTALYQDGVDDCIVIPEDAYVPILASETDFSISFWWKADSPNPAFAKHFVSNYYSAGVGLGWLTRTDLYKTVIRAKKGGATVETIHVWTKAVDTDWHFFAMTRKGTAIKMYLDTDETFTVDAANYDGAVAEAGHPLSFGALRAVDNWAPGAIDDFRIYDYWMRDDQIAALGAM